MCLFVKTGCYPKIAEEDIICYKRVDDNRRYWMSSCGYSNHKFKWNVVETARIENRFGGEKVKHLFVDNNSFGTECIHEGFHARLDKDLVLEKARICIIPVGTEYCLGFNDEIVAVKMIVFHTIFNYYLYKTKKYVFKIFKRKL